MTLDRRASLLFLISLGIYTTLSLALAFTANVAVMLLLNAFAVSIPAFLIPSVIFRRKNRLPVFRAPKFGHIMLALLLGIGCIFLNIAVGCLNSALTYGIDINSNALDVQESLKSAGIPVMIIAVAIVPAISEEFLMRGTLLECWRRISPFGAIMLTSLLFGLLHTSPSNFLVYFAMGILFGVVYNITRNVWLTVVIHFVNNLLSVLISAAYMNEEFAQQLESAEGLAGSQELGGLIAGFFSYLLIAAVIIVPIVFALRASCRRNGIGMYAPEDGGVCEAAFADGRTSRPLYDANTGRPLYETDPSAPKFDPATGEPLYKARPAQAMFDTATGAPLDKADRGRLWSDPFIWIAVAILIVLNVFSGLVEFGVIYY